MNSLLNKEAKNCSQHESETVKTKMVACVVWAIHFKCECRYDSEAVSRPYQPQNFIFFFGHRLMEVLNIFLTMNQFLKIPQKYLSQNHQKFCKICLKSPKIKFSISLTTVETLLGPNLVLVYNSHV